MSRNTMHSSGTHHHLAGKYQGKKTPDGKPSILLSDRPSPFQGDPNHAIADHMRSMRNQPHTTPTRRKNGS